MSRFIFIFVVLLACCSSDPNQFYGRAIEHFYSGDLENTSEMARRGRRATTQSDTDPMVWRLLFLETEAEIYLNRFDRARVLLKEQPPSSDEFISQRAQRSMLLGLADICQEHFDSGQRNLEDAHDLALQAMDKPLLAKIELFRTWLFMGLGDAQKAEDHAIQSLEHARNGSDRFLQGQAACELSLIRVNQGKYDAALDPLEDIAGSIPDDWYIKGNMLTNMGLCSSRLGHYEQGREYLAAARKIHESSNNPTGIFSTWGELGNNAFFQGDYAAAKKAYTNAYDIALKAHNQSQAALWAGNLAATLIQLQSWDEASKWNDRAEEHSRQSGAPKIGGYSGYRKLNRAMIAVGKKQAEQAILLFEELAAEGALPDIRWESLAGLGNLHVAKGQVEEAKRAYREALDEVDRTLSKVVRDDHEMSYFARLIDLHRGYVDFLIEIGLEWEAFTVAESARARVLRDRLGQSAQLGKVAGVDEIQRLAETSGELLASYWLAPDRSFLWVFAPGGKSFFQLPPSGEIDVLVREYLKSIDDHHDFLASPIAEGEKLYKILVSPLEPYLNDRVKLVLVPDGSLHSLNFEALPLPGGEPEYLLSRITLAIAPSLQLFASSAKNETSQSEEMLLIGDPYPVDSTYPRLKYAKAEIENIKELFPTNNRTFTDLDAHPQTYQLANPAEFSMIHFSAHGVANWAHPLDSAVILAQTPQTGTYKLYARNVLDIPIGAEVVTISCCTSAGNRIYAGEGLIGFAWAFLQAGAHHVVAGSWKVDDRATALLMDAFYEYLIVLKDVPEALAAAKRSMFHKVGINPHYSKPFYWAAFQVYAR